MCIRDSINTVHLLLCILRNENDPTTKLLLKLNIDYDVVKEQFKLMIASDDQNYVDLPSSSSFPDEKDDVEDSGKENHNTDGRSEFSCIFCCVRRPFQFVGKGPIPEP